jgi:mRNA-degrading endonuclease toxin of MazEF toxin-antitoxin module
MSQSIRLARGKEAGGARDFKDVIKQDLFACKAVNAPIINGRARYIPFSVDIQAGRLDAADGRPFEGRTTYSTHYTGGLRFL